MTVEQFFQVLDQERLRRASELSDSKSFALSVSGGNFETLVSKSVIVLAYANWEGFYNFCIEKYVAFLKSTGKRIVDVEQRLIIGVIEPSLQALKDKNHSYSSKVSFVDSLPACMNYGFDKFDSKCISARSNLNFKKLSDNFNVLNFQLVNFQPNRLKLDKEIVGWRHAVAHGSEPDLTQLDIEEHISLVQDLLLTLSDCFQENALEHV